MPSLGGLREINIDPSASSGISSPLQCAALADKILLDCATSKSLSVPFVTIDVADLSKLAAMVKFLAEMKP